MRFLVPARRRRNVNARDSSACFASESELLSIKEIAECELRQNFACVLIKFSARMRHRARWEMRTSWNRTRGLETIHWELIHWLNMGFEPHWEQRVLLWRPWLHLTVPFESFSSFVPLVLLFLLLFRFTFSNFVLIYQTFRWCRAWTNKRKQNISSHEDDSIVSFESI